MEIRQIWQAYSTTFGDSDEKVAWLNLTTRLPLSYFGNVLRLLFCTSLRETASQSAELLPQTCFRSDSTATLMNVGAKKLAAYMYLYR